MMRLFDTRQREIVPFEPGPVVTMYTCGITPYDAAHIGHITTYLAYDVLQRRLRDLGHETRCVRNVTDVDDDIFKRARELGVDPVELTDSQVALFNDVMERMGMLDAYSTPLASSAIEAIIEMVADLVALGAGYVSGNAVYFSVNSFSPFGELSHLDREEMLKLAAERGGNVEDPQKRDPLDFVLWQPSLPDELSWPSPWGEGRPGWHIECSALARRELGATIDLHGGGEDLVFPHHECEIAQSETVGPRPFVRHWMHVAMVNYQGDKMSKSLGNLVFAQDLLKSWEPAVIRLAIMSNHYRTEWSWSDSLLDDAAARLERWRSAGVGEAGLEEVRAALDEDLDTPAAIAAIDTATASGGIGSAASLLGVSL